MMKLRHLLTGVCLLICIAGRSQEASVRPDSVSQPQPVVLPDSTIERLNRYEQQLRALTIEKETLKELLTESQQEVFTKNQEIEQIEARIDVSKRESDSKIKELESRNDSLVRVMISMASNFIYIPYEAYSIEQIAIPAFQAARNSVLYDQHRIRLEILQNYRVDVEFLVDYLDSATEELSIGLTALREQKAREYTSKLTQSSPYLRYNRYDDWKATFLGKTMSEILADLKSPTGETATNLGAIRDKLSKTLTNQ